MTKLNLIHQQQQNYKSPYKMTKYFDDILEKKLSIYFLWNFDESSRLKKKHALNFLMKLSTFYKSCI